MPSETRSVLDPLAEAIRNLNELLRQQEIPATIIGGVAASLIGRPRLTKDVDFLVHLDEQKWPAFLQAAEAAGFSPRRNDALSFARESRVLLLCHQPSKIEVDITFETTSFEGEIIQRSSMVEIDGLPLQLPKPEDLIIMKWLAHRPQDILDVGGIVDARPNLDVAGIRGSLAQFAEYVEGFDLLGEFDALLARRKRET